MKAAGNPVADPDACHPVADRLNFAGAVGQGYYAELGRTATAAFEDHQITVIERTCPDPHQDFVRPRSRLFGRSPHDPANAAEAVYVIGFHLYLGEIRDRTFENQSFRASGLSLITTAIVHWNTVYLARAVHQLRAQGITVPNDLLAHVAPLGWEHIALTGDYVWSTAEPQAGFRPLRDVRAAFLPQAA